MNILHHNLFDEILINPINSGANKLLIVSGYATANMAARHIHYVKKILKKQIDIELIVGMCGQDGLEIQNHVSLLQLQKSNDTNFKCDYIINRPPVHSKVYTWLKDDKPFVSFLGSANYTQNAFSKSQREVASEINPLSAYDYFKSLSTETANCEADNDFLSSNIDFYERKRVIFELNNEHEADKSKNYPGAEKVTLTLLDSYSGEVPKRSGLNWGQRPEYGRDPNQAYINIPAPIGRSGFFPDIRNVFTIITDDDKQLICVRAQENGKGLHTTLNNSLMGQYFRYRIGLKNGEEVTLQHLLTYGRTSVDIHKIDDETYYMDFSV
ncbi:MAG: restriction endonuclease PLD domain-containing protein [Bacteroidia bacterium]